MNISKMLEKTAVQVALVLLLAVVVLMLIPGLVAGALFSLTGDGFWWGFAIGALFMPLEVASSIVSGRFNRRGPQ